jgi:hypothetical protein
MADHYREGLPRVPDFMRDLPVDPRGFPVPWFTPWDGAKQQWNFQAITPGRMAKAVRERRCWICGKKLFVNLAFTIGPMCAINRTTSEPPSHCECAEFAAKACPFLTRPRMRRAPMPEDTPPPPGFHLERNPGVALVWVTREPPEPFRVPNGMLLKIGEPIRVEAFAEGRAATPDEVVDSIVSGLPSLLALVETKDDEEELTRRLAAARRVLRLPAFELPLLGA